MSTETSPAERSEAAIRDDHPAVIAAAEVIETVRDEWHRSEEMKPPRRLQARMAIDAALPHLAEASTTTVLIATLLSDRMCDRILDELVVQAGGQRDMTDDRVPFARWDMRAALERALAAVGQEHAPTEGTNDA